LTTGQQTITTPKKRQARINIEAAQLPPQDFGIIYRIAFLGDSITNQSSGVLIYGSGFMANGFAAHFRYATRGMVEMVANTVEPSWDFGVSGAVTSDFQSGGSQRATFNAMLASDADTVIYALANNDIGAIATATTKSNMLSQWAEIEAAGKKLVILSLFPGSVIRQTNYLQGALTLNHWIEYQAALRGALYVNITRVCDDNRDGVSDMAWMQDLIHPNATGAARIGYYLADMLAPYFSEANAFAFPAFDSASWVTPNPWANSGTVGANQTATSWVVGAVGAGTAVVKNLVDRTDIPGVGNWQECVITGATDAGILIANPTHYVQAYVTSAALTITAGDRFFGVCEIQPVDDSTFYGVSCYMLDNNDGSTTRRYDLDPNGGLASCKAGKYNPLRYGILRTPELVFSASVTHTLRMFTFIYGNGTLRLGRFGIKKV
jgi:lysophospholipase L1-like esterase